MDRARGRGRTLHSGPLGLFGPHTPDSQGPPRGKAGPRWMPLGGQDCTVQVACLGRQLSQLCGFRFLLCLPSPACSSWPPPPPLEINSPGEATCNGAADLRGLRDGPSFDPQALGFQITPREWPASPAPFWRV